MIRAGRARGRVSIAASQRRDFRSLKRGPSPAFAVKTSTAYQCSVCLQMHSIKDLTPCEQCDEQMNGREAA